MCGPALCDLLCLRFGGSIGLSSTLTKLSIFLTFSFLLAMSRELRLCPGVGGQKCGAFLSSLDRDPHPTCTRCRGRVCTKDLSCDICVDWSSAQWEAFAKKRSYAERKRSVRPSGSSLPPAPKTSSEVAHPAAPSSSSSLPSEGRDERGGGFQDAPCAASHGASSPPARRVSSERSGSASGRSSGASERASVVSSACSRAEDPGVARSQRTPVARSAPSSVASPHSSLHAL